MRLSISARVFSGFAAVLATFALVAAFSVYQLHRVGMGLSLVSQAYHPLTRLAAQLEASCRDSGQASDRLLEETDPGTRRGLLRLAIEYHPQAARDKVKAAQAVVLKARNTPAGANESLFLDRLDGLLTAVLVRYDEYARAGADVRALLDHLDAEAAAGVPSSAREAELAPAIRKLKKIEAGIESTIKDFSSELDDRIDQRVQQAGAEERRSALMTVGFSVLAVFVGLFITLITQRILAPIRRLTDAVKDVGEGRFARELAVHSNDELALLAREFNAMARKLRERDRQLQEKTAEVLRAERLAAVGRLAAQITHEIRNPLSSLSLNTELLQERLDGGIQDSDGRAEAQGLLRSMSREMERLTEITEEYLRFARTPKPALAPVDLNDAVEELLDFMSAELASSGISVARELVPSAPRVRADAAQLRQLLLNLVRNAREAAASGGHIRARTRLEPDGKAAVVEIDDDGPGIPGDVRARVFEPFFTTKERGTGLGLAVVQQIAHEHGGDVTCQPILPHGSRFAVSLPIAEAAITAAEPEPPADIVAAR